MGEKKMNHLELRGDDRRFFVRQVLEDLRALERVLDEGMIEVGKRRIGAEQEMFLVDSNWRPAPIAPEVLEELPASHFTSELGLFNLEGNLDPLHFGGDCLSAMERGLRGLVEQVQQAAAKRGAKVALTGILPTLLKADLDVANMTPEARYHALNQALSEMRGGAYELWIRGLDELKVKHDSIMLEACNTSLQVHFQVGAEEFANIYNIAQAVAGPVLAAATNSPLLFGKRLWRETRIALFEQSVDSRISGHHLRERTPRVSFGNRWVRDSIVDIYRDDIARFRPLVGGDLDEDPFEAIDQGRAPALKALCLHNGTVYRWNRACYGITDGRPHLRIENRVLPAGPTIVDEVANAAFWFGLISAMAARYEDITELMDFEEAKYNFHAAARSGLQAELHWLEGQTCPAGELVCDHLLPLAREGLERWDLDSADIDLYLGVLDERVRTRRTGSHWILESLGQMKDEGAMGDRLNALVAATVARQKDERPVSEWEPARLDEAGGWHHRFQHVEQFMTTNIITVHEDEPLDLVASIMEWERVRHVPVEDHDNRLVGLVSYRSLLRAYASGGLDGDRSQVSVSDIMIRDPLTVTPETSPMELIQLMKRREVGCVPVLKEGRLVGAVTEHDFMEVAAELIQKHLEE